MNSLTLALAKELGKDGIRVNAVAPGTTDTDFGLGACDGGVASEAVFRGQQKEAPVPLGRMGEPREVAQTIIFLLSDKASYVTASILDVNGGVRDQPGIPG